MSARRFLKALSIAARPVELMLLKREFKVLAPVIIVGPARSGTTLVYQALTSSLSVAYLPKFVTLFPAASVTAAALWRSRYRSKAQTSNFTSQYGKSGGLNGISQGHEIWSRWFKWDYPGTSLSDTKKLALAQTINGISFYLDQPLAIKWPGFSAHIKELTRVLPDAFFIFTDRDTAPMARSIYKGRIDLLGTPKGSISRSPDGRHLSPDADPISDIIGYIYAVRKEIQLRCKVLSSKQFQIVNYEDLCGCPESVVNIFRAKYQAWSKTILKCERSLPQSFQASSGPPLPEGLEAQLAKAVGNNNIKMLSDV